jgi:hypothetical protein
MVNYVEKNYIEKVGKYKVVISNIDLKTNDKGNKYFEFILKNENEATKKIIINCQNSDKACEIGYGTLLKLLRALNENGLIENCKFLEPKADDYNNLFKAIIENGIIGRINTETEFILELYNKKPKEQFDVISGENKLVIEISEKFYPVDEKLDDKIPF